MEHELDRMDFERHPDSIGDQAEVGRVRGHDGRQSASRPLDHGHIDDIVVARTRRQGVPVARAGLSTDLDAAAFQEPQRRLMTTPPSPTQNSWGTTGGKPRLSAAR